MVYLDGTESRGSPSVNVIAKYGRHTKFLFFKVWVPELPLDVELSDNKLSQIKGWKGPVHQTMYVPLFCHTAVCHFCYLKKIVW